MWTWIVTNKEFIFKIVAGVGAIIGFFIGLSHYAEAQKWQKAQVILNLMDAFKADPLIQAACLMLDWDQRDINLPDGRRIEFANDKLLDALRVFYMDESKKIPMDWSAFASKENAGATTFTAEQTLIRDCFDRFFDFFDKVHAFRANDLAQITDFRYFSYWFELVRVIGKYKGKSQIQSAVDLYIKTYNFHGFRELCDEYSKNPDPLLAHLVDGSSSGQSK